MSDDAHMLHQGHDCRLLSCKPIILHTLVVSSNWACSLVVWPVTASQAGLVGSDWCMSVGLGLY